MSKEKKQIDAAWNVYRREVERVAEYLLDTEVSPYFANNNMIFSSGMGIYCISHNGMYVDPKTLPKWLRDILDMEIPGMEANSLGSIMNTGA